MLENYNQLKAGPSLQKSFKFNIFLMKEMGWEVESEFLKDTADHKCADTTLSMTSHPRWQVKETLGFKAPRYLPTEYEDIRKKKKKLNKNP